MNVLYLAVFVVVIAMLILARRRAPQSSPTSCADLANAARVHDLGDGRTIRDAQAEWLRNQVLITSESVITTAQRARAEIRHAGAAEARAVLDDLQQQAADHPEGVPGSLVAHARLRFDAAMRSNLQ